MLISPAPAHIPSAPAQLARWQRALPTVTVIPADYSNGTPHGLQWANHASTQIAEAIALYGDVQDRVGRPGPPVIVGHSTLAREMAVVVGRAADLLSAAERSVMGAVASPKLAPVSRDLRRLAEEIGRLAEHAHSDAATVAAVYERVSSRTKPAPVWTRERWSDLFTGALAAATQLTPYAATHHGI